MSTQKAYAEKLKDPRWQKLRLEVMNRDEFTCQFCSDDSTTLNVHHLTYTAADPWDEPIENLLTLCCVCHEMEHANREKQEKRLLTLLKEKRFTYAGIRDITDGLNDMEIFYNPDLMASVIKRMLGDGECMRERIDEYFKYLRQKEEK